MSPSCTFFSFASVFWLSVGLRLQVFALFRLFQVFLIFLFHTHPKMSLRFIFSPRQSLQNTSKTVIAVWHLKSISRPWDAFTAQLESSREARSYLERSRWCVRKHCINLEIFRGYKAVSAALKGTESAIASFILLLFIGRGLWPWQSSQIWPLSQTQLWRTKGLGQKVTEKLTISVIEIRVCFVERRELYWIRTIIKVALS